MTKSFSVPHYRVSFIDSVKRLANKLKKQSGQKHAEALDIIASKFGYKNWSQFHQDIINMSDAKFGQIKFEFESKYLVNISGYIFDEESAIETMRSWVRQNFTPLVDFAFYDSESSNGYAWADEDINLALQEEFLEKFPLELIEKVADDLEINHGPWGIEKY